MKKSTFELICFVQFFAQCLSSVVTSSLTIKIDETLLIENCSNILDNLEHISTQLSEKLHSVTEGRTTIRHFDILLPDSWAKSSSCVQSRTVSSATTNYKTSDVHIVKDSHQNKPWALQYGQCGVKGQGVHISSSSLADTSAISSSFVNETFKQLLQNQYGIFLDDITLSPMSDCNNHIMNECSNTTTYDRDEATKQNLLCNGQSPLQVILSGNDNSEPEAFRMPTFSFMTTSPNLYILVIDRMMETNDAQAQQFSPNWELIQNAFFLFISKLQPGSALSIITYGSEPTLNLAPTLVTKSNSAELFAKIPRRHLSSPQVFVESCSQCGLNMALKIAEASRLTPSIILLSKIPFQPSEKEDEKLPPVFTIGLTPSVTQVQTKRADQVMSYVMPECDKKWKCLFELSQILTTVSNEINGQDLTSFHRSSLEVDNSNPVSGHFEVEENLNENLWIVLTSGDEKDIESFELNDPAGRRYQFPKFEHGFVYFALSGSNPTGRWSYNLKLYEASRKTVQLDISAKKSKKDEVTSDEKDVTVKAWTMVDKVESSKIFIYAQIFKNNVPHNGEVTVEAIVSRPAMEPIRIQLRDLGTGYPDIRPKDGIYSAYFTKFSPEPGHYHVEIVATSKQFERHVLANSFYAEQATGFYVRQGSSIPVNDVFPPSRITDLKIESVLEDSLFVSLSWSSPGGDYDEGKAFRYEIRCSTNKEALRNDQYAEASILVDASLVPTPAEYGVRQDCSVGVPWEGQNFYYAVVGFDEAGNKGEISNSISVRIDRPKEEPVVTLLPFVEFKPSISSPSRTSSGIGETILDPHYAIIAYVTCSLLIAMAVIAVATWRIMILLKNRPKQDSEESQLSSDRLNNSNITTEDIWSLSSSSDEKVANKSSLHFVSENNINLQSELFYHDMDLIKDVDLLSSLVIPPRVSVLEDMSVYRDLSNLDSQSLDYFALSQRLSILLYGDDEAGRKESLV